jgi:ATP adenylyltransferase/5',5'''-P-1,P-4-tetraphosphate phosphorylase II
VSALSLDWQLVDISCKLSLLRKKYSTYEVWCKHKKLKKKQYNFCHTGHCLSVFRKGKERFYAVEVAPFYDTTTKQAEKA